MLHSHNSYSDDHYAFFITSSVVEWLPIFGIEPYRRIIVDSLAYVREHKRTELNGYVIMPTHIHAILWPERGMRIGDVLRDFKRFTSRAISRLAEDRGDAEYLAAFVRVRQAGRALERSTYQVWQDGSHPEAVFTAGFARQKLQYVHNNPVKAGLVKTAVEWPHSSARNYLMGDASILQVDLMAV